jgi:hypothetical protein
MMKAKLRQVFGDGCMPKSPSVKPSIILIKRETLESIFNDPEWYAKLNACQSFMGVHDVIKAYAISRNLKVKEIIINE